MSVIAAVLAASLIQPPTIQHQADSVVVVSVPADPEAHSLTTWTKVLGAATVVLSVGSVASFVLLIGQGRDLKAQHKTLEETRDHLAEQAVQLRASVETARTNAAIELRAYITVAIDTTRLTHPSMWLDHRSKVGLVVTNTGKTPAKDITTRLEYLWKEVNWAMRESFPNESQEQRGMLAAEAYIEATLTSPEVPQVEEPSIEYDSTHALFVVSMVNYTDVFGNGHWTAFTRRINWDKGNYVVTAPEWGNDFT
jgi:hypothetical protein